MTRSKNQKKITGREQDASVVTTDRAPNVELRRPHLFILTAGRTIPGFDPGRFFEIGKQGIRGRELPEGS